MGSFLPLHTGSLRSDVPEEVVYETFEKNYFHNLIDTAFIWLSTLGWREGHLCGSVG